MDVRIVRADELTDEEVKAWEFARLQDERFRSPYCCLDFTRIISQCRDDARIIAAKTQDGSHIFIPVHISGAGLARPIGAPFSDSNGPVLHVGDEALLPEILSRAGVAALRYNGVDDAGGALASSNRETSEAYTADLKVGFADYLESRRSTYPKHFKKARRLGRQAAREAGELELRFHEADPDTLDVLIDWKRDQYMRTQLHDVLAPEWARNMLHKFLRTDSDCVQGVLTTLRIGDELAAAEIGLRSGDVLHGWIAGYNPAFSSFSPGILLQERLLEAACEAGVIRADLGTGAGHYKKYYASRTIEHQEGVVLAKGALGATRGALSGAWNSLEQGSYGKTSQLAGKVRRRLENILAVETTMSGRVRGVLRAFNKSSD